MTPRINQNLSKDQTISMFSELIVNQAHSQIEKFNFQKEGPLLNFLHPKQVRSMLSFISSGPEELSSASPWALYDSPERALLDFPHYEVLRATPANIFFHVSSLKHACIFNFESMGCVVFEARETIPADLTRVLLLPFLDYALSNDLWGPEGKWTRFHERLHTHFTKYHLLKGSSRPGHYELDPSLESKFLDLKIRGTLYQGYLTLTLPWTFGLKELESLENLLQQEF
jgi:hypothetical protein